MILHGKISERGRIVVPAPIRKSLGLEPGSDVVLREHNGELHIISLNQAIQQIQKLAQTLVPDDISLVDEVIAMRQAEVRKEDQESKHSESSVL